MWRDAATFVCDAVDDHLTIQEAFDTLGTGSEVWLAPGSYYLDEIAADYSITLPTGGTLRGLGGYDWVALFPINNFASGGLGIIGCASNSAVSDLSIITGTGAKGIVVPAAGVGTKISRVYVETVSSHPIHVQGADNVTIDGVYTFESGDSVASIKADSSSHQLRVTGSKTFGGLTSLDVVASDQVFIDHNIFEFSNDDGILYTSTTTGVWGLIIANNTIQGSNLGDATGKAAIRLVGPTGGDPPTPPGTERFGPQILGNYIFDIGAAARGHGIHITDLEAVLISGNQIHDIREHGIVLIDVDRGNVSGNIVAFCGEGADATYDGIHLDSDSNRCYIHGNTVIDRVSGNRARYGVRINSADCDANIVVGNDLRASGVTADYSDAGTGTINLYPAGAAGDNFV